MVETYTRLGYQHCCLLSPEETARMDPSCADFCESHSVVVEGVRCWKRGSHALLRPGGCLNTHVFIPQVIAYLTKKMGVYVNARG